MTESREMMIARAREWADQRYDMAGLDWKNCQFWLADFAIQEIERYKESLAKDAVEPANEGVLKL
jgi:hypothetical protein